VHAKLKDKLDRVREKVLKGTADPEDALAIEKQIKEIYINRA
jgi:hypothetical protein